jgi:parvulin-like peptidyl-prolyl isomerase
MALILVAALAVSGCGWFTRLFGPKERVVYPTQEFAVTSQPAVTATPAVPETVQPAPAVSRPAVAPPATLPPVLPVEPAPPATAPSPPRPGPSATAPTSYRVVGQPEVVSAAVIQVNDRFITLEQVLHPIRQKLQAAAKDGDEPAFRREALVLIREEIRRQVEDTLLMAEADNRLDEQEKKAIQEEAQARVRQAVAETGGSRTRLDERLRREGSSLQTWEEELRRGLTVQAYAVRRFSSRIAVNYRMLRDYYDAHRGDFRSPESVQMQVIAVPFRSFLPTTREATEADYFAAGRLAKETMDKAVAALGTGGDFAEVARQFSRDAMASSGGVWPVMERGSFRAASVEEAAFAQRPGEVSKVIEAADGYYVVKTLQVNPPREQTFEQAQAKIEDELRRQQYRKLTREYLDSIQSKTTLQAAERFEETALEAAVRLYLPGG